LEADGQGARGRLGREVQRGDQIEGCGPAAVGVPAVDALPSVSSTPRWRNVDTGYRFLDHARYLDAWFAQLSATGLLSTPRVRDDRASYLDGPAIPPGFFFERHCAIGTSLLVRTDQVIE